MNDNLFTNTNLNNLNDNLVQNVNMKDNLIYNIILDKELNKICL